MIAVRLARNFNGEVISADSRQVYKGLDIGSGKITKSEMKGVKHHLLDIVSPKRLFTVAQFQKLGRQAIEEVVSRNKTPIVCGGTGFYIQALVDGTMFPDVPPNHSLRSRLEKKSASELALMLKRLDPKRYKNIDLKNPRRLIRAIEIAKALGKVPTQKKQSKYGVLLIGITTNSEELKRKIKRRLLARIRGGMIKEVENLHRQGVSWKKLESFGLEYRDVAFYLQNKLSKKEMANRLEIEIGQFAKRQMAWFKRDKRIKWFIPNEWAEIKEGVKKFLN